MFIYGYIMISKVCISHVYLLLYHDIQGVYLMFIYGYIMISKVCISHVYLWL